MVRLTLQLFMDGFKQGSAGPACLNTCGRFRISRLLGVQTAPCLNSLCANGFRPPTWVFPAGGGGGGGRGGLRDFGVFREPWTAENGSWVLKQPLMFQHVAFWPPTF